MTSLISKDRFRSPLARARNWGSARSGTHHWWIMRTSALALIPLSIWLVASVLGLVHGAQIDVVEWLQQPVNAILMVLFLAFGFYHGANGLQVVLEDYVHGEFTRTVLLLIIKAAALLFAVSSIYAVFFMSFLGGLS